MFSFGCTAYVLVTGYPTGYRKEPKLPDKRVDFTIWLDELKDSITTTFGGTFDTCDARLLANTIMECLSTDPSKRPSIDTIFVRLKQYVERQRLQ